MRLEDFFFWKFHQSELANNKKLATILLGDFLPTELNFCCCFSFVWLNLVLLFGIQFNNAKKRKTNRKRKMLKKNERELDTMKWNESKKWQLLFNNNNNKIVKKKDVSLNENDDDNDDDNGGGHSSFSMENCYSERGREMCLSPSSFVDDDDNGDDENVLQWKVGWFKNVCDCDEWRRMKIWIPYDQNKTAVKMCTAAVFCCCFVNFFEFLNFLGSLVTQTNKHLPWFNDDDVKKTQKSKKRVYNFRQH